MATRIPINKESGLGFEDRQKRIWEDMEVDMERRRREWEEEIEKMRKEFFMLRPEEQTRGSTSALPPMGPTVPLGFGQRSRLLDTSSSADDSRGMVVKDDKGNPVFKVLFDVQDYRPEEVSVKMDANKIMVSACHEAKQGGSSVSREYSREVRIPKELDPLTLQCTLGPDGILAVEAPIPAPSYAAIKDVTTSMPIRTGSPSMTTPLQQSSSSYQTYQTQRGANLGSQPVLPAGFKPVSAPFQNSAASAVGSSQQPHQMSSASSTQTSYRESSSPVPAYSKVSPPFQSLANQQAASSYSPPLKRAAGGRIGSPVVSTEPGKFKLQIDIEDFKPEELTVKTQDKRVVVCAKREEKSGNHSSTRELSREYMIPEAVDPLAIKAFFTDGGKLIIEAPYRDAGLLSQVSGR